MEGRASSLSLRERAGVRVDPVVNAAPSAFCRPLALTLSLRASAGVRAVSGRSERKSRLNP
jgi:hypothetical protein